MFTGQSSFTVLQPHGHIFFSDEWTIEDLSSITKVPASALRRRLSFWQNHGLISETTPGIFTLLEKESEKSQYEDMSLAEADEEDLESAMASASDQREEELQVSAFNCSSFRLFLIQLFRRFFGPILLECSRILTPCQLTESTRC